MGYLVMVQDFNSMFNTLSRSERNSLLLTYKKTANRYSLLGLGILLIAGICLLAQPTLSHAQTPVTKIENASGDSVLTVLDDGGFAAFGNFGNGTLAATGSGTRVMWYPNRAAFRAGEVTGSQWDDGSIGNKSVAFGYNTKASGDHAVAMGYKSTAKDYGDVALGRQTTADGSSSGVINSGGATALGYETTSTGIGATAMGNGAQASGEASTAMGNSTASGDRAVATGAATEASGTNSVSMNYVTTASGFNATAMGAVTTAASPHSVSIGRCNNANTSNDNTLLVVGNETGAGVNCDSRSDALVLDESGNLTISGSLNESSDRRLKKNITPLQDNVLGKLSTITPSSFEFKNQEKHPSGPQLGLIAQEVQQKFPELVSKAGNGYLSVSYSKFTAVLLKGMQEQQNQLEKQRKKNQKQAQQIAALQKKLEEIQQNERQLAGLPLSTLAVLFAGMAIGGGLWWRSRGEQ